MATDNLIKVYDAGSGLVPKFSLTPDTGIAVLDVDFIDEQFTGGNTIIKAYVSIATNDIIKVYR
jgi:hypothetical protein